MARGTKASPEVTFSTADLACARRCGSRAVVSRIGPSRFVVIVASASFSVWSFASTSSARMIPALFTSTFSPGKAATIRATKPGMPAPSATSNSTVAIPGFAAATSASMFALRPATMTVLPAL